MNSARNIGITHGLTTGIVKRGMVKTAATLRSAPGQSMLTKLLEYLGGGAESAVKYVSPTMGRKLRDVGSVSQKAVPGLGLEAAEGLTQPQASKALKRMRQTLGGIVLGGAGTGTALAGAGAVNALSNLGDDEKEGGRDIRFGRDEDY